jgi:hypothetical protein
MAVKDQEVPELEIDGARYEIEDSKVDLESRISN